MDREEVEAGVVNAVRTWEELSLRQGKSYTLTEGAIDTIAQIIIKIQNDPSHFWISMERDDTQKYVLSILPNLLVEISQPLTYQSKTKTEISTWEILHEISSVLDKWCPIPKDI